MNINLELYKVFYYVAKNQSISRAANELMISQPAISKSIKTLEELINTELFIRKRDGVQLTEAGETIYKKVKNALMLINSAEEDILSLTKMTSGVINIGASKTIIQEFLMPLIKKFHEEYPGIKVRIYTQRTSELIKTANNGLVDIIFTNFPYSYPNNFESIKLLDIHDCFVANNNFDYLKNKVLTLDELSKLPLLLITPGASTRVYIDEFALNNNITLNPEMEFSSYTLVKEFTKGGFGVGLLTREFLKDELKNEELFEIKFEKKLPDKQIGMLFESERKNNIIISNFIDFIKKNIDTN